MDPSGARVLKARSGEARGSEVEACGSRDAAAQEVGRARREGVRVAGGGGVGVSAVAGVSGVRREGPLMRIVMQ